MLSLPITSKGWDLVVIFAAIGAIGKGLAPLTINHGFFCFKNQC
jgi:hypothetical protein